MATEAIEAIDVADQLEYEKDNNSWSSQSQIKITKRILTVKVKEANDARKKASSNEVKKLKDLTSIEFKVTIPDVKTMSFHALSLEPIQTLESLLLTSTSSSDPHALFLLFWPKWL